MKWTIAKARQRFAELLREAGQSPQTIFNRNRPVAAVIDAGLFEEFAAWYAERKGRSVADAFDELRALCAEEGYALEPPPRHDRENPLTEVLDELSG